MIKVVITGNIACGKSLIESFLKDMNISVIDADKVVHSLYLQNSFQDKIKNLFKDFDIIENSEISRKKIAQIVFSDKKMMRKLEQILHPEVRVEIEKFLIEHSIEGIVCASIPLLFESKMEDLFDKIIIVTASCDNQIKRLKKRSGCTEKEAIQRISSQASQEEKVKKSDFVIDNNGSKDEAKKQLIEIIEEIKSNRLM